MKTLDVAKSMIKMAGVDNVKIEFTGLRPGEKLNEELWYKHEAAEPTANPKILHVKRGSQINIDIGKHLAALDNFSKDRDIGRIISALKDIVPEFTPQFVKPAEVSAIPS